MLVSPYDIAPLRQILGLTPNQDVPEEVLRRYETVRSRITRLNPGAMAPEALAIIALFDLRTSRDDELPPDPQNWRISVRRYNREHEGRFLRKTGSGLYLVALDEDPQDKAARLVPAANVTFIEQLDTAAVSSESPEEQDRG